MTELFEDWVDRAREADILNEATRFGARLRRAGTEYVGACPVCGDGGKRGADRYSVNPQRRVFHCRRCSVGGDVIALVMHASGRDFKAACEAINGAPPPGRQSGETEAERQEREIRLAARAAEVAAREAKRQADSERYRNDERDRCWEIWQTARALEGSVASHYLRRRGIRRQIGLRLKAHAGLGFYGGEDGCTRLAVLPAMIAAICLPSGDFRGVHITYLDPETAQKATVADPETGEILPAKKVRGSLDGSVIRLCGRANDPADLVIGEGIETTLARRERLYHAGNDAAGTSFWAAITLGNFAGKAAESVPRLDGLTMTDKLGRQRRVKVGSPVPASEPGGIVLPQSVERVLILQDGDSDPIETEYKTRRAAIRWARDGRTILRSVAPAGMDENDVLMRELAGEPA
jgi:hypothetical protein